MTDVIVVVNAGSSSLKFGLYAAGSDTTEPLVTGKVTGIGRRPVLDARVEGDGVAATTPLNDIPIDPTHEWITAQLLGRLANGYTRYKPVAAGHRVVHGGREFDGRSSSMRRSAGSLKASRRWRPCINRTISRRSMPSPR